MTYQFCLGQLRHLYQLMLDGKIKDPSRAAKLLLGPVIENLEQHDHPPECGTCLKAMEEKAFALAAIRMLVKETEKIGGYEMELNDVESKDNE